MMQYKMTRQSWITPKSGARDCAQWRMSLSPPTITRWTAADHSRAVVLVWFLLKVIWSRCFMSYFVFYCWLFVCKLWRIGCPVGEERVSLSAIVYL